MAIVVIATRWWQAQCLRCGFTWGPYVFDPIDTPFCYLCGVDGMVIEENGFMMTLRGHKDV